MRYQGKIRENYLELVKRNKDLNTITSKWYSLLLSLDETVRICYPALKERSICIVVNEIQLQVEQLSLNENILLRKLRAGNSAHVFLSDLKTHLTSVGDSATGERFIDWNLPHPERRSRLIITENVGNGSARVWWVRKAVHHHQGPG